MAKEAAELIVNVIVNIIDFFMVYYLCCNLIEKRGKLTVKLASCGLLYGTILGLAANYLDGYSYRLLAFIASMTILLLVSKKKIYDSLIIYVIIIVCIFIAQIPSVIILSHIDLNKICIALIIQTTALFIVMLAYKKMPLYKLPNIVEKELLLKLFFFILYGVLCIILFYLNLDVSDLKFYILYFSILMLITLIGLYKTIKKIFFYTNKAPIILHDMKNVMMGMYISANSTSDMDVVRTDLNKYLESMDLDVKVDGIAADNCERNIISFIEHKKFESTKKLVFDTQVNYGEHNPKFPFPNIIYTLGVLLDNAIEAVKTDKPILIEVFVTKSILNITVAHDDINRRLQEGYSIKPEESEHEKGYGLPNLSRMVTKHGGDILIEHVYNEKYKSSYLTITISF